MMGWIHYLASEGRERELEDHLISCGFKSPLEAARKFIKTTNNLKENEDEMPSVRIQRSRKLQPTKKNSSTPFRKVKKNTKDT
jgi:hypothetical protein